MPWTRVSSILPPGPPEPPSSPHAVTPPAATTAARASPIALRIVCLSSCRRVGPAARPSVISRLAAPLVEIDGGDEHRPHHDLLPERLDAEDLEAVLQDGGDEHADDRAGDGPDAA